MNSSHDDDDGTLLIPEQPPTEVYTNSRDCIVISQQNESGPEGSMWVVINPLMAAKLARRLLDLSHELLGEATANALVEASSRKKPGSFGFGTNDGEQNG